MPNNSRTNLIVETQTSLLQILHTHIHGDHTAGNPFFGKMGVLNPARDELREQMIHPPRTATVRGLICRPLAYSAPASGRSNPSTGSFNPERGRLFRLMRPGATPFIPHTLRTCLQKISFSANWSWREVPAVCVRIPALGL